MQTYHFNKAVPGAERMFGMNTPDFGTNEKAPQGPSY